MGYYLSNLTAVKPGPISEISLQASNPKAIAELKAGLAELGRTLDLDFTAGGNPAGAIIAKRQEIASLQGAVMASNLRNKEKLASTLAGLSRQLRRGGGKLAMQGRL